jgi:hypothetical protein
MSKKTAHSRPTDPASNGVAYVMTDLGAAFLHVAALHDTPKTDGAMATAVTYHQ